MIIKVIYFTRVLFLLALFAFFISSCHHTDSKNFAKLKQDSINCERSKIAVINDSMQTKWIVKKNCIYWIPSPKDFKIVEMIVKEANTNLESFGHDGIKSYDSYYKQLVCYKNELGDSIVYLNAVCEFLNKPIIDKNGILRTQRFDWQHQLLIVNDGGSCYWNICINISKRKYCNFFINGVA